MGWASANEIFDPVCEAMIQAVREQGIEEVVAERILTVLIRELQNRGWDTEAESLGAYADWTFVVDAFEAQGVALEDEEEDEDELEADSRHLRY